MKIKTLHIGIIIVLLGVALRSNSQEETSSQLPTDSIQKEKSWLPNSILRSINLNKRYAHNNIADPTLVNHQHETFDQTIRGSASGLTTTQTNGQPLGQLSIYIRGINTLAAGSQPLYLIDGFPLYNDNTASSIGFGFGPNINALEFLNPQDIQSIEVIKDPASLAMYGARGSNGVISIHTKYSNLDESAIEFNSYVGIQEDINHYDVLDGTQFASYFNEALANSGRPVKYDNPSAFGSGTDWRKQVYNTSPIIQYYNLSFAKSNAESAFRISANYGNRQGLLSGSRYDRFSINARLKSKLGDKASFDNMLNVSHLNSDLVSTDDAATGSSVGLINGIHHFNPLLPVYTAEGRLVVLNHQLNADGSLSNKLQSSIKLLSPQALELASTSQISNTRIMDHFHFDYHLLESLKFQLSAGIDALFNEEYSFTNGVLQPQLTIGGTGRGGQLQYYNWVSNLTLEYHRKWQHEQAFKALIGVGVQKYQSERLNGISNGFENQALGFYDLSVGSDKKILSFYNEWQLRSYYAHWSYSLKEKYFVTLSARSDGSSRFNGSSSLFPAVGLSWKVSEESFFSKDNLDWQLRLSYGITGNQEIPPFATLGILDQVESPLGESSVTGFRPFSLAVNNLEIEKTGQLNIGTDISLLNHRLDISFDAYFKSTKNALLYLPLPGNTGVATSISNGAEIKNSGVDLSIHSKNTTNALKWDTWLHLGYLKNNITSIENDISISGGRKLLGIEDWTIIQSGSSIGSYYGYRSDGIVQTGEVNVIGFSGQDLQPGERKYKDLNQDGIINRSDKSIIGSPLPDVSIGVINTLRYKSVDLSIHLFGMFGNEVANFNKFTLESLDGRTNNTIAAFENRWTTSNPSNSYPRLDYTPRENVFSDAQVENGSFLRLQSISLGVTFPDKLMNKLGLDNLRIYASSHNLLTLTKYSGIDPDVSHFGQSILEQSVDFGGYPKSKSFIIGINIRF